MKTTITNNYPSAAVELLIMDHLGPGGWHRNDFRVCVDVDTYTSGDRRSELDGYAMRGLPDIYYGDDGHTRQTGTTWTVHCNVAGINPADTAKNFSFLRDYQYDTESGTLMHDPNGARVIVV